MSDNGSTVVVSDQDVPTTDEVSTAEGSGEKQVPAKAFEQMQKDMHKFKNRAREKDAMLNEYAAKLKSIEEQRLVEEKRWEELYKKEKDERIALEKQTHEAGERFNKSVKMSQLKSELGGNIKDQYLQFANLDAIELQDDGTIDPDSVHRVANEFRHSYPELVPSTNKALITNTAAPNFGTPQAEKTLDDMSFAEKAQLLKELKNK